VGGGESTVTVEQLDVQERVHKSLRSVMVIEVKIEERVPQKVAQLEEVI
jgi:hypothetical protein